MAWTHLLASITGTVDQELLLRNAYLVTENRILRDQIKGRLRLREGERKTLADIGQTLGNKTLEELPLSSNPIRFSAGTAHWSPRSWPYRRERATRRHRRV